MRATLDVPNIGAETPMVLSSAAQPASLGAAQDKTTFRVLVAISFCHLLNDMIQSLIPAMYPILKNTFALDFGQVGLITLAFQLTASLLQPVIGIYTDRRPLPYSLAVGMGSTLVGLLMLSVAWSYAIVVVSVAMVGLGSAVFHPESSRVARMASGGRHGLAQSIFQVGGNAGASLGPLCAAFVVVPYGQPSVRWFSVAALLGIIILANVGTWYKHERAATVRPAAATAAKLRLPRRTVAISVTILAALMFSKFVYTASMSSYFTFYLIDRFRLTTQQAQVHLFIYLGAVAAGTIIGGPVGDRFGRKVVIWFSILGVFPFTAMMPYADLFWTGILSVIIGLILSSAFSAIIVYAQELVPGNVGAIAGLFFGFAFGMGGLGAAALGQLADHTSIQFVYKVCSFLPLLGLLTWFLPALETGKRRKAN